MYYTVVSHICIEFKILAYKIQTVVDDQLSDDFKNSITNADEKSIANNWIIKDVQINNRKIEKKLHEYIQTHQKLIRY